MTQYVEVEHSCSRCSTAGRAIHRQRCSTHGVSYSVSFQCSACGLAFETDGLATPENVHQVMIEKNGRWLLHLADPGQGKVDALRALAEVMGTSTKHGLELVNAEHLLEGTETEVKCLHMRLTQKRIRTVAQKCS